MARDRTIRNKRISSTYKRLGEMPWTPDEPCLGSWHEKELRRHRRRLRGPESAALYLLSNPRDGRTLAPAIAVGPFAR